MKKKIAYLSMFLALALVCSYVETLIPFPIGIPGVKLGLTNIIVILVLYCIGEKEAILISILRIFLSGFMFGNAFAIIYSLAGGILSFIFMMLMKRTKKFSVITVSVAGGISHNIGQMLLASVLIESYYIVSYLPVLLISGTITGFLIGVLGQEIIIRIKRFFDTNVPKRE
ncbi:MAG: Gx transporter family protein [Agathobacter sp.]|nr:Gx transporter family protein [Agathobacter sp.]